MNRKQQRFEGPGAWLKNFLSQKYGPHAVEQFQIDSLPQSDDPSMFRGPEFEFDPLPS